MKRLWDKGETVDDLILAYTVGEDPQWDERLVQFDIQASIAHAEMLTEQALIPQRIGNILADRLQEIGRDHLAGLWSITMEEEDCHTAIENRLGPEGAYIHLGRSRNDQVLTALRLYLIEANRNLQNLANQIADALERFDVSQQRIRLPGYTHLQRAMASTIGEWLGGFATEIRTDADQFRQTRLFTGTNPLGTAAGYGTPGLRLNRDRTTESLGFDRTQNPAPAAQLSRGKAEAATAFACTILMQDIGRLASDLVLYSTAEFGFVRLPKAFTTGSSIMPQKRNPDVFELIRAHSAQAPAALQSILAITAKMTSGYHRDLQLIKAPLFRLLDQTIASSKIMLHAIPALTFDAEACRRALDPSLQAAEEAYQLVQAEGIPFREAYRKIGEKYR